MVEAIKSPILILLELLIGLIQQFNSTFEFIYVKLVELFIILGTISGFGPMGLIIAVIFGSLVLFLVLKFIFGSSKTLMVIFLLYLLLLIFITISISVAPIPTT